MHVFHYNTIKDFFGIANSQGLGRWSIMGAKSGERSLRTTLKEKTGKKFDAKLHILASANMPVHITQLGEIILNFMHLRFHSFSRNFSSIFLRQFLAFQKKIS